MEFIVWVESRLAGKTLAVKKSQHSIVVVGYRIKLGGALRSARRQTGSIR